MADRMLFSQHDARWIETGSPGAGNILIFNNGKNRPDGNYSSVDEIVPPVDEHGDYYLEPDSAYGPDDASWSFSADPPEGLYAASISGAHRLPNGNTIICAGPDGVFLEVTPAKEVVWAYVNPISESGLLTHGEPGLFNAVFRAHRYGPDYPAFVGKDLTPGDPLELFTRPIPVPGGESTTEPMMASRVTPAGDRIQLDWDASSCMADEYNLIYGPLADMSAYTVEGAECAIGVAGIHDWVDVPAGDLFFVIVGVDDTGVYESSWGADGFGAQRAGTSASWMCGVTTKDATERCP